MASSARPAGGRGGEKENRLDFLATQEGEKATASPLQFTRRKGKHLKEGKKVSRSWEEGEEREERRNSITFC